MNDDDQDVLTRVEEETEEDESAETWDLDERAKRMGLSTDEANGPHELNDAEELANEEK